MAANAGSGKTHVLAQRVIRLLLAGVDPARILCITFTKAAAANMANRVFDDLRTWTVLDDAALDEAMREDRRASASTPAAAPRARRLFALALETPGGLKVQTIHAFCTRLLHQFPFEANVAARFEVLDETEQNQLLEQLSLDVLLEGRRRAGQRARPRAGQAVLAAADVTFRDLVREAIRQRDKLMRWLEAAGGVPQAMAQLSRALGVDAGRDDRQQVEARDLRRQPDRRRPNGPRSARLCAASSNDRQGARRALPRAGGAERHRAARRLSSIFSAPASSDKVRDKIGTLRSRRRIPACASGSTEERDRVWTLLLRKRALEARDRSIALFTIADAVIERYPRREGPPRPARLRRPDRQDAATCSTTRRAAWVHYKLDLGIDHVLIDEAQDTSPKQWEIVKALVAEFFAGAGRARPAQRTIFAVGDEKQSIFSFQGAAPREFDDDARPLRQRCTSDAQLDFVATDVQALVPLGADRAGRGRYGVRASRPRTPG